MLTVAEMLRRKGTRIVTVRLRETAATAAMLMKRENISALVVKDVCRSEGNIFPVGVFSERDLARALATHGAAALGMPISALLTQPLVSCRQEDTIETVMRLMTENQVRLLPVLDEHTLVGVISISDVVGQLLPDVQPRAVAPARSAAHA